MYGWWFWISLSLFFVEIYWVNAQNVLINEIHHSLGLLLGKKKTELQALDDENWFLLIVFLINFNAPLDWLSDALNFYCLTAF
jgi:hypothetical protein